MTARNTWPHITGHLACRLCTTHMHTHAHTTQARTPVVAERLDRPQARVAQHAVHVGEKVRRGPGQPKQVLPRDLRLPVCPHAHDAVDHAVRVAAVRQRAVAEGLRVHLRWDSCLGLVLLGGRLAAVTGVGGERVGGEKGVGGERVDCNGREHQQCSK